MNSRTTRDFRTGFEKLPAKIQKLARKNYRLWVRDASHPSLHFKKISANEPIFSVRVGLDYRAIGLLIGDTMVWYWIGPHSEYDKILSRL